MMTDEVSGHDLYYSTEVGPQLECKYLVLGLMDALKPPSILFVPLIQNHCFGSMFNNLGQMSSSAVWGSNSSWRQPWPLTGGSDSCCSCFSLVCRPPQFMLEVTVWSQLNHISCKRQRSNYEVPKLDTGLPTTLLWDLVHENQKHNQGQWTIEANPNWTDVWLLAGNMDTTLTTSSMVKKAKRHPILPQTTQVTQS